MIRLAGLVLGMRVFRFAMIGAFGTVLNILIMMALVAAGVDYILAAIVAGETTIVTNFLLQEKIAFADLGKRRRPFLHRFLHSFTFNTFEAVARIPLLWMLVEYVHMPSPVAQAGTLCASFFVRYAYHLKMVYALEKVPMVAGSRRPAVITDAAGDPE
ncbi:GtrA family protein [Arthrobacter nitrophenolicus]|uniref:Dolichol-phosphate mannosyltransferase n=2 Tax=Arthrobacter nitrophenolicus TaxID=683150 RepID=A0ACC6TD78_9MICC|nr:GtrA family protein [Arthrobacter nitrophenolicus]ELT45934.1 membrane protein [Arthrobacter nitrophenolicus]